MLRHRLCRENAKHQQRIWREHAEEATSDINSFWRLAKAAHKQEQRFSFAPTLHSNDREYTTATKKAALLRQTLFAPAPNADLSDIEAYVSAAVNAAVNTSPTPGASPAAEAEDPRYPEPISTPSLT